MIGYGGICRGRLILKFVPFVYLFGINLATILSKPYFGIISQREGSCDWKLSVAKPTTFLFDVNYWDLVTFFFVLFVEISWMVWLFLTYFY